MTNLRHNSAIILLAGPLCSTSVDVSSQDWRLLMMGDIGGWGGARGSKEARVTLKHTLHGQSNPALQVSSHCHLTQTDHIQIYSIYMDWMNWFCVCTSFLCIYFTSLHMFKINKQQHSQTISSYDGNVLSLCFIGKYLSLWRLKPGEDSLSPS